MEEKRDLTLEYIRYSRSEQDLAEYCKENNLDYLEFVDVVNKWNEHYGIPLVEKCMHPFSFVTQLILLWELDLNRNLFNSM